MEVDLLEFHRAPEAPTNTFAPAASFAGRLIDGNDQNLGFNAQTEKYADLVAAGVIDPTKVVRSTLQDAASVAGLLITTEAAVADHSEDKGSADMAGAMGGGMGF